MEYLKFVITGDVDHGKSTLIGRLLLETNSLSREKVAEFKNISEALGNDNALAYVTDQLKEEREQNKTIDTTQIFLKTKKRNYCIIDTPGHLEFIKNMLTGTSSAQAAVLIVDVNVGITRQTRRHAYLVKMLGINQIIAAFNKMDLINYNADKFNILSNELLEFLKGLGVVPSFMVPISAKEGINILKKSRKTAWYKGPSLIKALGLLKLSTGCLEKPFRLPVQDVYKLGAKRVIVGRLESGSLKVSQRVLILPRNKEARVSSIKAFGEHNKQKACAAENIGLVLDDSFFVRRGEMLVDKKNPPSLTRYFKGNLFWMSDEPLEINNKFTLRCSTQEVECWAERIEKRIDFSTLEIIEENSKELKLNEAATVIFRTEKPIVAEKFSFIEELGRFIIERGGNLRGAGVITEEAA